MMQQFCFLIVFMFFFVIMRLMSLDFQSTIPVKISSDDATLLPLAAKMCILGHSSTQYYKMIIMR